MASISELREALKVRLQTVPGLRCYDVMPGSLQPPAAVVLHRSGAFAQDFDDSTRYGFDVEIYTSYADMVRGERALDVYLAPSGTGSVRAALEGDPHLGELADWVKVTGWTRRTGYVQASGTELLQHTLEVEISA